MNECKFYLVANERKYPLGANRVYAQAISKRLELVMKKKINVYTHCRLITSDEHFEPTNGEKQKNSSIVGLP